MRIHAAVVGKLGPVRPSSDGRGALAMRCSRAVFDVFAQRGRLAGVEVVESVDSQSCSSVPWPGVAPDELGQRLSTLLNVCLVTNDHASQCECIRSRSTGDKLCDACGAGFYIRDLEHREEFQLP